MCRVHWLILGFDFFFYSHFSFRQIVSLEMKHDTHTDQSSAVGVYRERKLVGSGFLSSPHFTPFCKDKNVDTNKERHRDSRSCYCYYYIKTLAWLAGRTLVFAGEWLLCRARRWWLVEATAWRTSTLHSSMHVCGYERLSKLCVYINSWGQRPGLSSRWTTGAPSGSSYFLSRDVIVVFFILFITLRSFVQNLEKKEKIIELW